MLASAHRIVAAHPGETVLVVSHGGALNALWHDALGERLGRWGNCAVYGLEFRDGAFVAVTGRPRGLWDGVIGSGGGATVSPQEHAQYSFRGKRRTWRRIALRLLVGAERRAAPPRRRIAPGTYKGKMASPVTVTVAGDKVTIKAARSVPWPRGRFDAP